MFQLKLFFIKYDNQLPSKQQTFLKKLEHRKLGWKVLILKNYLGKSLSKEMWCKMADTKKIDYIF